jgi:hypothetical protein
LFLIGSYLEWVRAIIAEMVGKSFSLIITALIIFPLNYNLIYSETSIHHFRRRSEKETMDSGKQ